MFVLFQALILIDGFFTWTLIGQGVLAVLAGASRHSNVIYQALKKINTPPCTLMRILTRNKLPDAYLGVIALPLLLLLRVVLYAVWYANGWIPEGIGGMPAM